MPSRKSADFAAQANKANILAILIARRFTHEAELEILETVTFYKERAGDIAADFFNEFRKAREEIKAFPEFWKDVGQGYRRKLIERYPFGIIYRIDGE
ncbi:MAG: hypothetical protein QNL68_14955 [Akkermansiaceae bacterium]